MGLIIVFTIAFAVWIVGERVVQQRYDKLARKDKEDAPELLAD